MANFVENLVSKAAGLSKLPKPELHPSPSSSLSLFGSSSKFEWPASKNNPDIQLISEEVPNVPKENNEKIPSSGSRNVDKSISSISNSRFSLEEQSSPSDEISRESGQKNLSLKEAENPYSNKSEATLEIKAPESALKNHPGQSTSSEIQSSMQNDSSELFPEKKSRSIQPELELEVSKKSKKIPSPSLESPEEYGVSKLGNMNYPEDKAIGKTTTEQTLTKEISEKNGIHESDEIKSEPHREILNMKKTEWPCTKNSLKNFEIPSLRNGTIKQDLLSIPPETHTRTHEEPSISRSEKMIAHTPEKQLKNRTAQKESSASQKLGSSIESSSQVNQPKRMRHLIKPERKQEIQSTSNEITEKNEILNASQKKNIHTIKIEPAPTNHSQEFINNLSKRINLNSSYIQPQLNMVKSTKNQPNKEVRINIGRVEIKASRPVKVQSNPPVRDFNDFLMARMYLDRNYF